eukprot:SAG22_NODE_424_length_10663_cov_93.402026_16_plen_414_part_00
MGDVTGFHNTHSTQSSKVLFIDSKDATQRHQGETTHFTYVFRDSIIVQQNEGVLLSLLQASIPYSFYNVRAGINDSIDVLVEFGGHLSEHQIVMEAGNYTAITLSQLFKEKLQTVLSAPATTTDGTSTRLAASVNIVIDYDRDTQKFKFSMSHTGTDDRGTIRVILNLTHGQSKNTHFDVELGFDSDTAQQSVYFGAAARIAEESENNGQPDNGTIHVYKINGRPFVQNATSNGKAFLMSDNIADLNGSVHSLYLRTNLPVLSTMDSLTGSQSNIVAKIPINTGPGGIIFHEPRDSLHKSLIHTRVIKALEIRITDDRNRVVSLNGLHFSIALQLEFVSIRKNILPLDPRQTKPFGLRGDIRNLLNKKIVSNNKDGKINRTGSKRVHSSKSAAATRKDTRRKTNVKSTKGGGK